MRLWSQWSLVWPAERGKEEKNNTPPAHVFDFLLLSISRPFCLPQTVPEDEGAAALPLSAMVGKAMDAERIPLNTSDVAQAVRSLSHSMTSALSFPGTMQKNKKHTKE